MAKQTGTLIAATVRVNDSLDTYAVAIDNEIKGGKHSVDTTATRDAIPAERRSAGMECYVAADGNTYELGNDLVTWTLLKGTTGGSTDPGAGGNTPTAQLISGNFGEWTAPGAITGELVNVNFPLQYKADLLAFPTRAIVYLQGQFGLNSAFSGSTITLGNLPAACRPVNQLKKYFICQNIELFLVVEPDGDIKIEAKDEFLLPVSTGTPESQPYYIECYFSPAPSTYTPTTYTYTRTENFTRNDCQTQNIGSVVSYSQTYTSTIDEPTAQAIAMADTAYTAAGQAYANANGTCTLDPAHNAFAVNNRNAGSQQIIFTDSHGHQSTLGGVLPGSTGFQNLDNSETYSIDIINTSGPDLYASINGSDKELIAAGDNFEFIGLTTIITITLTDH